VPTARGLAAGGPLQDWMAAGGEVMTMRRYLLVLDMDLLALDEELDLELVNYLLAQQEQRAAYYFRLARLSVWSADRICSAPAPFGMPSSASASRSGVGLRAGLMLSRGRARPLW